MIKSKMHLIQVRSNTTQGVIYSVDLDKCSCSCRAGYTGTCCKHIFKASQVHKVPLAFLREYSQATRYEAAVLAFGVTKVDFANYEDIYHGLTGGDGVHVGPPPSPLQSPIQPPPPFGQSPGGQVQQSPAIVASVRSGPVPITPNQRSRMEELADKLRDEVLRGALLAVQTEGFNSAESDFSKLIDRFHHVKTGGQFQEVSRGLSATLNSFRLRRGRISVNGRAIQRRKGKNGSSRPLPKGGVKKKTPLVKAAASSIKKAKRKLNFG